MFIRTKHDPERKRTRIQIVQSVRTGQKVRQKVVRHVGIAHNDTEVADLKRLAGRIMEELRASQSPQMELFTPTEYADLATLVRTAPRPEKLNVDLGECREESRLSLGLRDVMGEVYSGLGWNGLLGTRRKSSDRILRELVLARLSQPESKRATVDALAHRVGITLNLDPGQTHEIFIQENYGINSPNTGDKRGEFVKSGPDQSPIGIFWPYRPSVQGIGAFMRLP